MRTILYILMVLTSFWLISCRSVEKSKSSSEESILVESLKKDLEQIKQQLNISTSLEIRTNIQTGTVTTKKTTKPIDPLKPAAVTDKSGNKTILENAQLEEEETTTTTNIDKNEKQQSELNAKTEASKKSEEAKKAESKKADAKLDLSRKPIKWLTILWFLIPLILYLLWKNWKIIKQKIWWV